MPVVELDVVALKWIAILLLRLTTLGVICDPTEVLALGSVRLEIDRLLLHLEKKGTEWHPHHGSGGDAAR